jgi:hypothetical protein
LFVRPTSALATWMFSLLLAAGCTGNIDTADGPGGGARSGAGGGSRGPEVTPGSCRTEEVPRTPLRRLTRFEYENTVRDLLNIDASAAAALPADEVTNSFDNNAAVLTVSALHAEKYVLVSEALAGQAVQSVAGLSACESVDREEACARDFARSFGRRAFRRPVSADDEQMLMAAYAAGRSGGSHAEGIEVMIRAALQSPSFLYRLETAPASRAGSLVPLSQFELATRLSYMIWASGPDDALLDMAERGELSTKPQVADKAREMLAHPKARAAIANFVGQWTSVRRLDITTKSSQLFPLFSSELRDAMARELPAFVEHVLWSGDHSLRTLLTAPLGFVSGPLAQLYGVTAPAGAEPVRVDLPAYRSGILTQAGFLSVQAHPDQTSPVLRGKFVRAMLMCQPPPPPPPDADVSLPMVDQGATARERFSAHLSAGTSCNGCHSLMDPIGLAFENFDSIGQYRETDNGQAIDASGEIFGTDDATLSGPFEGVRELGDKLARSRQVRECLATQWFRFASGRTEGPADACSIASLADAFDRSEGDVLELVIGMTQTDAFWYRSGVTP